jgi:hypothetical protein
MYIAGAGLLFGTCYLIWMNFNKEESPTTAKPLAGTALPQEPTLPVAASAAPQTMPMPEIERVAVKAAAPVRPAGNFQPVQPVFVKTVESNPTLSSVDHFGKPVIIKESI